MKLWIGEYGNDRQGRNLAHPKLEEDMLISTIATLFNAYFHPNKIGDVYLQTLD